MMHWLRPIRWGGSGVSGCVLAGVLGLAPFEAGAAEARAVVPFSLPAGLEANLFASDPWFSNPVAVSAAQDGKVYVTQTRRRKAQNLDIRNNADWIEYELGLGSVADKERFYRWMLAAENSEANKGRVKDYNGDGLHDWRDLKALSESIHQLVDEDGDGTADRATVFADDFRTMVTGVAAGVMAHGGEVYTTIAPDVWRLRDLDGDGEADERTAIATGFAVHVAYAGHNMHGLIMGPDGRIYWSIGDIGSDYHPNEGAVFRCNPDGSGFEVYARGLRNPQEIGFNQYGDILTGDNDGDFGDRERWYHVVEGGDYGWRNWWQYQVGENWGAEKHTYSTWNEEGLWHVWFPEQAAYVIPPVHYIAGGPCGMSYYPGTGMGEEWADTFFLAHFTGSPNSSGIFVYRSERVGASYELTRDEKVMSGLVPTGVDFAPDGRSMFMADWDGGWDLNEKGRVWRVYDPAARDSEAALQASRVLKEGMRERETGEVAALLHHANMNVRREAQFEAVRRGEKGKRLLVREAQEGATQLGRIHALWGLEQLARQGELEGVAAVMNLLKDPDSEVRAQTAKVMGEAGWAPAAPWLVKVLEDESARVRYFAAMSLGKLNHEKAWQPILDLLEETGDSDRILRHAGIMALAGIGDVPRLVELETHPSRAVRLAAVVALRKLERPEVTAFLGDADELIVLEAARTINDVPMEEGRGELADLIERDFRALEDRVEEWLLRRVLNANYRVGTAEHAQRLAEFAAMEGQLPEMRLEALRMLESWEKPSPRDRVVGGWFLHGRPERPGVEVQEAIESRILALLEAPDAVRAKAIQVAQKAGIGLDDETLVGWLEDESGDAAGGAVILDFLVDRKSPFVDRALEIVAEKGSGELLRRGLELIGQRDVGKALGVIREQVEEGKELTDRQISVRALGLLKGREVEGQLKRWLEQRAAGQWPAELSLDLTLAAERRKAAAEEETGVEGGKRRPQDLLADVLHGGDYNRGRELFLKQAELQCLRCHASGDMQGLSGGTAAPDLAGIGQEKDRRYLAESIFYPNQTFADGYEQVIVRMKGGDAYSGRIVSETEEELVLGMPAADDEEAIFSGSTAAVEERMIRLAKDDVQKREQGLSGMPEGLGEMMSRLQLRDLMEYLARQ